MSGRLQPSITSFSLERYRAFEATGDVRLGRLTLLLGRNNAGKSALCFAPLHFAQAFRPGAAAPLIAGNDELDFGSPQSAIFCRQATGTSVTLSLAAAGAVGDVTLGVTVVPERNYAQKVTVFQTVEHGVAALDYRLVD